jgi:hypothetical protein
MKSQMDSARGGGGDRGLGLAECAAALLVLAAGALAGMELVALSARAGDTLRRASAANCLCAGRLEELQALPFDDPALRPGGSLRLPLPGYSEDVTLDGRVWRLYLRIVMEGAHGKVITLRITLASEENQAPGTRLSTMVFR